MWRESALLHLPVICFTSDKGTRFVSIFGVFLLWFVDHGGGYDKLHQ